MTKADYTDDLALLGNILAQAESLLQIKQSSYAFNKKEPSSL